MTLKSIEINRFYSRMIYIILVLLSTIEIFRALLAGGPNYWISLLLIFVMLNMLGGLAARHYRVSIESLVCEISVLMMILMIIILGVMQIDTGLRSELVHKQLILSFVVYFDVYRITSLNQMIIDATKIVEMEALEESIRRGDENDTQ